ncbi:BamA/TamA family outer membrane protein [Ichthyobacterium seriolicida]|uniref:Translocation protein TolB n=1 Tax=Ichthyobacterium seriolicida TaxID=242600 RepID=A0A1J1E469_9FLAO|nr:hypothetical protein [Ichthyobacterium seriolicida]BAV94844.1 hypothetical protein JBKA6_0831 [Ichthyobacterium seriolicida]
MKQKKYLFYFTFFLILSNLSVRAQFYYGNQQQYGKSVVVYKGFEWNFYRYDPYDVYYYIKSKKIAEYILHSLPREMKRLDSIFDIEFDQRIKIICFKSMEDLKQSNLNDNAQDSFDTSGTLSVDYDKLFVYGVGDKKGLDIQFRQIMARMYITYLLNGNKLMTNIKNTDDAFGKITPWFIDGLSAFIANRDSPDFNDKIRDGIKYDYLQSLSYHNDDVNISFGYSIWKYVSEKYGHEIISDLIYLCTISKDTRKGFEIALGITYENFLKEWRNFYLEKFDIKSIEEEKEKLRDIIVDSGVEDKIFNISYSSISNTIAYTTHDRGEYSINILDLETKKKIKTFEGGYKISRNEDTSFPIISLNPQGTQLCFYTERENMLYINIYDIESDEIFQKNIAQFEKINDISYNGKGDKIVLSATVEGYSDIYVYTPSLNVVEKITKDSYEDHNPIFVNGDKYIVFSSNRLTDTIKFSNEYRLGGDKYKLFLYDYENKSPVLKKITHDRDTEDKTLQSIGKDFIYSRVESDSIIRKRVEIDNVISHIDTVIHYKLQFKQQNVDHIDNDNTNSTLQIDAKNNTLSQVIIDDNEYKVQITKDYVINKNNDLDIIEQTDEEVDTSNEDLSPNVETKKYPVDIYNYTFENDVLESFGIKNYDHKIMVEEKSGNDIILRSERHMINRRFYDILFFPTGIKLKLDPFENIDYQIYTGGPVTLRSGSNVLFNIELKDIFEDYILSGRFKVQPSWVPGFSILPNNQVKLQLDDRNGRWNKSYTIYRTGAYNVNDVIHTNIITKGVKYGLTYPFDPIRKISMELGYRNDKLVLLSTERRTLKEKIKYKNYISSTVSYVYDNSRKIGLNLEDGLKYKVFITANFNMDESGGFMVNVGLDARYYHKIHRNLIWANRLAFGSSLTKLRLIHYLGGTDNEFSPDYNRNIPVSKKENYAFQTLMTNMRGFKQNVRNGNNVMLFNTEFRWPIFQYFYKSPISWQIVKHFQIVPFFDIGSAWNGLLPLQDEELKYETVKRKLTTIKMNRLLSPIVYAYGIGIRTQIFGYFLRIDYAIGVDTYEENRRLHFSLNFDF